MKKHMVRARFFLLVFCCSLLFCLNVSADSDQLTIPKYKIEAPDPSLPKELQAFSGVWKGRWITPWRSQGFESLLIVERIQKDNADIIYCWGGVYGQNNGNVKIKAKVGNQGNNCTISWSNKSSPIDFLFTLKGEKVIGIRKDGNYNNEARIEMTRISIQNEN